MTKATKKNQHTNEKKNVIVGESCGDMCACNEPCACERDEKTGQCTCEGECSCHNGEENNCCGGGCGCSDGNGVMISEEDFAALQEILGKFDEETEPSEEAMIEVEEILKKYQN